jgi:hypothetical protein
MLQSSVSEVRPLLYTGVTRGKRMVVLVGQKMAVAIAVRNASGAPSLVETAGVASSQYGRCQRNLSAVRENLMPAAPNGTSLPHLGAD